MIRHIVLFKMKPEAANKMEELAQALRGLPNKIDCIEEFEAGVDIVGTSNSFDVGLNSTFASRENLDTYRDHPEHVKVVAFIKEICSDTVKVDYTT